MIDEKHRHEIAEAMRRCDSKAFGWPIGLASAIARASDGGQDPLHELADLIDRPTCESIKHGRPDESNVCKSCSRCSYGWFECIHDKPYSYCPNCGSVITDTLDASKADDALMEHDDVRMTPREVHELADDIKAFVLESDRPTCNDVGDDWTFHCSACGCELDLEDREGEPTMWLGESSMTPRHCPNCGAMVAEKEEDND